MRYEAIVIGVSSGGLKALKLIFSSLPSDFAVPVIVVQHIGPRSENGWINLLIDNCAIPIKEADEKESVATGNIYIAPSNYHLLIEKDKTFSLTIDERVNFARPSIDVLFESAAEAYKEKLIGIILTGANSDGTEGVRRIKEYGGLVIVQDPATAESSYMPASAISAIKPDHILELDQIGDLLIKISMSTNF
jgi:two-component system, chemotaxis family, protein-glutamate methylesterase/glutaminase